MDLVISVRVFGNSWQPSVSLAISHV